MDAKRLHAKRLKRKKKVLSKKRAGNSNLSKIGKILAEKKQKENMEKMSAILRKTLNLPDDDTTPFETMVEAVNLKMRESKIDNIDDSDKINSED